MKIAERLVTTRRDRFPDPRVRRGEYLCSRRHLYFVEQVAGQRALVEDCATGDLIDVAVDHLLTLRRLRTD